MTASLRLAVLLALATPALPQGSAGEPDTPLAVAVLVYPGVELLDFAGPGEVFAAARREGRRLFDVFTVAETGERLTSQGFVHLTPEHSFESCPQPDVLVVPGGGVPLSNEAVLEWVRRVSKGTQVTMSVCNGALLLSRAGLLEGLEATTHHGAIEALTLGSPGTTVLPGRRFVDSGHVLTAAGVSAGIDGSLHLVARLFGRAVAEETAYYMEYRWEPEAAEAYQQRVFGSSSLAPVLALVEVLRAEGPEAALAAWREQPDGPGETAVNRAGYALLETAGRREEALALLELNARRFPDSANVWDSLADACEALGRREEALRHVRRGLALVDAWQPPSEDFGARVRAGLEAKRARLEEPAPAAWVCPPCSGDCHARSYEGPGSCRGCGMALVPRAGD